MWNGEVSLDSDGRNMSFDSGRVIQARLFSGAVQHRLSSAGFCQLPVLS